ncbi:MAG: protein-(glutamine-N5) methyltransferase, release factor-specific [Lutibacter sp.]|nr:MAG: protein-(glutamine-N5) methyltransferase, release factor-specific [Lutibacter sp.]PHS53868.1 MAG: protein-(glutamine-N5) methyltransferase, release factor-specific [Lutibacter sp.]
MQIQKFKKHFFLELVNLYPETEIQSFFSILIEFKLNLTRIELALQPTTKFTREDLFFFQNALTDLKNNIPIQYIIGETTFYGLTFTVNHHVLIPRPETAELVDWIIKDAKYKKQLKILDIGTGSGCIAIALAKKIPNAEVFALDISAKALETAKLNANTNKVSIHFIESDILNLHKLAHTFDIIVSNPPYVRKLEKDQMLKNVVENEPHLALFVENENPLLFYKKIAELAKTHLSKNGILYFEINQYLGNETLELLKSNGFKKIELKKDIFEVNRMIKATII